MTRRKSSDEIAADMMREQWCAPSAREGHAVARYGGARYIARRSCDAKVVRGTC